MTTYVFDDFRRMRRQTSPVTGVTTYTHDPAGNLLTPTDANAATTTRTYDALNRVLTAVSTRTGFPTENVTFTYDNATSGNFGKGRLASMTDPTGSTTYAYERRGLLRLESRTVQGNAYSLAYAYDANGNRRQITYPSSLVVNYTFDVADRPLSAASATTYVTSAKYRPFGPLEQIRYGNGTTKTMDYDNRYRPTLNKLEKDSPLTTLAHYTLVPDFVGNITNITDVQNAGYNRTYGYDDLHRLTTANSGVSLWGTGSHGYDNMGNLTSLNLGAARTATFALVGTTPKLQSVTESGIGTRSVSYDLAGNETAVASATFTYSPRNFLDSGEGFTYAYDGNGLRTIATNASARRYAFYTPELNLLAETYLTTVTPPPIQHEYVWFADQPVAQIDDGTPDVTYWDFTDHLGTPFIQTDSAGAVIWREEYEPYGRIFALRTPNRYQILRLPGQEAQETNIVSTDGNGASERSYNVFRWYRFRWGRYSQVDPIGLAGSLNSYSYAAQNPIVEADADGLHSTGNRDDNCLLCTIYAEGRGTPPSCQWAVASVIVNRLGAVRTRGQRATICDIVSGAVGGFGPFYGYNDPSYRDCLRCVVPRDDRPDFDDLLRNFEHPFPVDPQAQFFASTGGRAGRRAVRYFERPRRRGGAHFVRVPFSNCDQFRFYNEVR